MQPMSGLQLVALFIATVIATLIAYNAGLRFGRFRKDKPDPEPLMPVRALVANINGLLAFILGFTFGLAFSHYDSRNQATFDEAIAIGTAYHRADFLSDPERTKLRQRLMDYIDRRIEVARSRDGDSIASLRELQRQIWVEAVAAARNETGPPSAAPLLQSLTEVIDVHGERVLAGVRSRIPLQIWAMLYGIMMLSVATAGYHAGLAGGRRSFAAVAYALVFAAVIVMIAAGDVPRSTQLKTSYQTLAELRARLIAP
jgi:hypothetical protein